MKSSRHRLLTIALHALLCLSLAAGLVAGAMQLDTLTAHRAGAPSDYEATALPASLSRPSVKVKASGYEALKISWDRVKNATKYQVYRATSKSGTYKRLTTTSKLSYSDKTADQNQTYYYKVRAVSGETKSSYSRIRSGSIDTGLTAEEIENIPAYSGEPYITIRDDEPSFAKRQYTKKSFESYAPLDSLGRCGVAFSNVGQDLMPTEKRGSIGMVKPSGWHTVRYDGLVDGNYLYNRCHLIGYQLTGENANTRNLITGTRYMNVEGMLPFEDAVADYVKETGRHVLYRVTPIFEGDDLVASGVEMEAASAEDRGEDLSFHVFVYNVQPGVAIDYATGESWRDAGTLPAGGSGSKKNDPAEGSSQKGAGKVGVSSQKTSGGAAAGSSEKGSGAAAGGGSGEISSFVLNTNTMKFHRPSCSSVDSISPRNRNDYTGSRDVLIRLGYEPCKRCDP